MENPTTMDSVTLIRLIAGLIFLVVVIPLYFLPTFVARKKRQFIPILVLNLLLGWTLIGWVGALVWALSSESQPMQVVVQQTPAVAQVSVLCSSCGKYSASGSKFCANCGPTYYNGARVRAMLSSVGGIVGWNLPIGGPGRFYARSRTVNVLFVKTSPC